MQPTIKLDSSRWQAAARELFQTSSRTCVDFTNGQALKVAVESVRQTEKANRAKIAQVLGQIASSVSFKQVSRGKNKGKMRTVRGPATVKQDSFAARILGKRFKETGKWGVKGDTMEERAANLIKARMRSATFIAAGWIAARNKLWSYVRQKPTGLTSTGGAKQLGKPKGNAKPANFAMTSKIQATIENAAFNTRPQPPSGKGDAMPVAKKGLQAALNVAAQDMIEELKRRLNPDFKRFNRK